MTSSNPDRLTRFSSSEIIELRRFTLNLVVRPGSQVLAHLSETLERHTGDPGHLIGLIGTEMRISVDLNGISPYGAERLTRCLIRQPFVLSLNGQCFDAKGREIFGISLYSPDHNSRV